MTYRLYYADDSAAMGARVVLEELGASYELISTSISMDLPRDPAVLALNPNGWIPVLVWEKGAIYECGAITTFLCDRHPEYHLAPGADDTERGLFLQWLFFFQVPCRMHTRCPTTRGDFATLIKAKPASNADRSHGCASCGMWLTMPLVKVIGCWVSASVLLVYNTYIDGVTAGRVNRYLVAAKGV